MDVWDGHLRVASSTNIEFACLLQNEGNGCSWKLQLVSDSVYHITVLKIPTNSETKALRHVGFLSNIKDVGKYTDNVMFLGRRGYLTPLGKSVHLVDMSNHSAPAIKGKLEYQSISFLHPYEDGKFLVIVGQDMTSVDLPQLRISLFNTTDFRNPVMISNLNAKIATSSQLEHNLKASHFLPSLNTLIIPTSSRDQKESNGFDGFTVFDVSPGSILKSFNINHVDSLMMKTFCWKDEYLAPRVLVHDSVVTTIKGHTVLAHNIRTKEKYWDLNLDKNNTDCGIRGYWSDEKYYYYTIV